MCDTSSRNICSRKSGPASMMNLLLRSSIIAEVRKRLSRLSIERQTSQVHPITGTPCDVPVPRNVKRIGVAVMGLEVPHAHVHLLPINSESDMNFFAEKKQIPAEEMKAIADKIFSKFNETNSESHPEIF